MEPLGATALTGDSYEEFPFKTTFSCLLLKYRKVRWNTYPEISWDLKVC